MGRKALFTKDEVFQAADELAQSEDVTVRSLHAYLGGGSFSSVLRHFNEWKSERAASPEAPKTEMPPSIAVAFDAVWKAAMGQALRELAGEREKAAQQVNDANVRVQEALGAVEELENTNNELTDKIEELTQKLDSSESKLSKAVNDISALSAVNSNLKEQVSKLQRSLDQLQVAHEDQQRKHADEMSAQAKSRAEEVSDLKVEMAKLEAAIDSAKEAAGKSQETVIKLEAKLESTTKQKDAAVTEAAELKGLLNGMKTQNEQLLERLSEKDKKPKQQ